MRLTICSAAVAALTALAAVAVRPAAAQTFSLNTDFNLAANTAANVFHYGEQSDFTQPFTLFTNRFTNQVPGDANTDFSGWGGSDNSFPFVLKQIRDTNTVLGGDTFTPGELLLHSDSGANAVIRFVAPQAGSYTVNANWELRGYNNNSDGVDVRLYKTGVATALSGAVLGSGGRGSGNPAVFNMNATTSLLAGETLEFSLGRFGDTLSDTTALSGTVTRNVAVVPESGTAVLLSLGVSAFGTVGLVLRRRARKAA